MREPKPDFLMNLVLSDKVFFSAVSCKLGGASSKSKRVPGDISLEHFQILTPDVQRAKIWPKKDVSTGI